MTSARKPTIVTAGYSNEVARALEPVKQSVEMITGARSGFNEIAGLPYKTSVSALFGKVNEIIARINASGGYKLQTETDKGALSDAGIQPKDLKFLPLTGGTLTGPVTGTTFTATTFTGSLAGNAETATSATNDADGLAIASTYLKLSGGSLVGDVVFSSTQFNIAPPTTESTASNNHPAVVIENYVNGTSWYRVWSDGWIEQGGVATLPSSNAFQTISFAKEMATTDYTVVYVRTRTTAGTGSAAYVGDTMVSVLSTTGFTIPRGYNSPARWYVCGY